jgi:p38 MAP kinase
MAEQMSIFDINNTIWSVPMRYTNLNPLGQGAFGLVCSSEDTITQKKVAIKKIAKPFATNIHAKRAYRELKLLKHVDHDNVICLLDLFTTAKSPETLDDIYLVTNLMGTDMNNVFKTQELTDDQIIFFTYQILRGLKYLHSSNIIHRDIKPGNLTVNENCELRIIDFGLARGEGEEMTGYVATRWYRAPEIMLKWMHYTKAVDIWSVGCILAEMFTQKPLFPGSDHVNQLNRILNVVGYPQAKLLNQINQDAKNYLERMENKPRRVVFPEFFSSIYQRSPEAVDLLDKMLQLDPNERITCEEALKHPFLRTFHDPEDEPTGILFDDKYENQDYSVADWKNKIFHEIITFVPPQMIADM